jgi:pyridoxal phosphate enzyme (YggS family)
VRLLVPLRVELKRLYDSVLPSKDLSLRDRIESVEERMLGALQRAGRKRSQVRLVAVTKKFSAAVIREGYQLGLREFGENYVQEFSGKKPDLQDLSEARFHMIGHLQSNKAALAADLFHVIQTVDSIKLLDRLDRALAESDGRLTALLEIKLSSEESKTGTDPANIPQLLDAASRCPRVNVAGLMTMPPWSEDQERSRPYFRELAALASKYGLSELSMGMSNDFEAAIEEGATIVRVGTALFGARPKPAGESQ